MRGVLDGVAGGAVHLRRAAQRVGVLHPVAVRSAVARRRRRSPASSAVRLAAESGLAGVRPERLQVGGEDPVGAPAGPRRASPRRCRRCAAASAGRSIASTSMPSMPSVPLISARPSLAASSTGARPAAASASAAGISVPVGVADLALAHQRERAVRRAARGRRSSRASRTRAPPG